MSNTSPNPSKRFQKGQSGNPKGRPSASQQRVVIIADILRETHIVETPSGKIEMTTLELVLAALRQAAAQDKAGAVEAWAHYSDQFQSSDTRQTSTIGLLVPESYTPENTPLPIEDAEKVP